MTKFLIIRFSAINDIVLMTFVRCLDAYDTFYQEQIEKIEINSGFANRIFIKEVYSGGFK